MHHEGGLNEEQRELTHIKGALEEALEDIKHSKELHNAHIKSAYELIEKAHEDTVHLIKKAGHSSHESHSLHRSGAIRRKR